VELYISSLKARYVLFPFNPKIEDGFSLPFVDNDPITAEIVSNVVMLAKDDQIKDLTILEQIL